MDTEIQVGPTGERLDGKRLLPLQVLGERVGR